MTSLYDITIIIVNYKSMDLILDCIKSIYGQTKNITFEIIVVDNNSGDNGQEILGSAYPDVRWIQMNYNAGFARANNAAILESNSETVLLLNPDTVIIDKSLELCYENFVDSRYIACGVQLLNTDGSPQISGNYFMIGSINNLLPLPCIGSIIKSLGGILNVKKPHVPDSSSLVEVDWINGAFLMVKKQAIEKVGLMDEDFFLYAEEAEWCYRLKKFGKMAIYGQCKVIHLQGEASNEVFDSSGKGYYNLYDKKGLQIMLSNFVRIRKQNGLGWFFIHLFIYTSTIPIFCLFQFIGSLSKIKSLGKRMGKVGDFSSNVLKVWTYFFTIVINKPFFYKVL